jgi:Spy/CpxP family protein refolding chaperone
MKTKKVKQTVAILAVVLMTSLTVSANNGNNRNNNVQAQRSCVNVIQDLTADQISSIKALETAHWEVMNDLRLNRRETTDERTSAEIRIKMIDQRDNHQAEVKKLLTPEQQVIYDALHTNKNNSQRFSNNGRQNGNNRGNSSVCGNGNGRGNNNGCPKERSNGKGNGNKNNRNNRR